MNRLKNKGYTKISFSPVSSCLPLFPVSVPYICFILISLLCIFPEFLSRVSLCNYKYIQVCILFFIRSVLCYVLCFHHPVFLGDIFILLRREFLYVFKKQCLVYMDVSLLIAVVLLMDTQLFENLLFRHAALSFRNVCLYSSRINS